MKSSKILYISIIHPLLIFLYIFIHRHAQSQQHVSKEKLQAQRSAHTGRCNPRMASRQVAGNGSPMRPHACTYAKFHAQPLRNTWEYSCQIPGSTSQKRDSQRFSNIFVIFWLRMWDYKPAWTTSILTWRDGSIRNTRIHPKVHN